MSRWVPECPVERHFVHLQHVGQRPLGAVLGQHAHVGDLDAAAQEPSDVRVLQLPVTMETW